MTASSADDLFRTAAAKAASALALVFLLAAPPSWAATSGPTMLLPDSERSPPSGGIQTPAPARASDSVLSPTPIRTQELGLPDINAIGVPDPYGSGLGMEMWAGSSIDLVRKVLPILPGAAPSPAMHRLERRFLLSAATPPQGRSPDPAWLIRLRAGGLWSMGDTDAVLSLLKTVPDSALPGDLRRLMVDAALLADDRATACGARDSLRAAMPEDPYPEKLQVYCQIAKGEVQEAMLGVDLLRERALDDPLFFAAADAAAGIGAGSRPDKNWGSASALDLAMFRLANLPIPESALRYIQPMALIRAVALTPSADIAARLAAAERTAATGALDTALLSQVYESVTFTPKELDAPAPDATARGRALLYRAAARQTSSAAKAGFIAKALNTTGRDYLLAARLYAPQIAAIAPAPQLAGFAPDAARALFATGFKNEAQGWAQLARGQATSDPAIAARNASLWVVQAIAAPGAENPVPEQSLAEWRKAADALPAEFRQRRLAVAYGVLAAFGRKVPAEDWLPLFDGPIQAAHPGASAAVWHGLRLAVENTRQGETVLMALLSLGGDGLDKIDAADLYRAVAALRLIGLEDDARALAVEAAIVNGA